MFYSSNFCENVLNQGAQKMMAHVTLWLSPSYNLKQIHAGLGMYTGLFTRVHIISINICKFQNNNSIMSGCTT